MNERVRGCTGGLTKFEAHGSWEGGPTFDELSHFHKEEMEHFEIAREAIEFLGGDPSAVTPAADIAAVASEGVLKVIMDPVPNLRRALKHSWLPSLPTTMAGVC